MNLPRRDDCVGLQWGLFFIIAASLYRLGHSYPTQAGWCPGGLPAVAGPHIDPDKKLTAGTLADGDYSIDIDRILKLDPSNDDENPSIVLKTNRDYYLRVAASERRYRGFLVRLEAEGADTTSALIPDELSQVASACLAPAVGISHFDRDLKNFASGILRLEEPGLGYLDVTVVRENTNLASSYYYSRYTILFESSDGTPSTSPPTPPTTTISPATEPTTSAPAPTPTSPVATTSAPTSSPPPATVPTVTDSPAIEPTGPSNAPAAMATTAPAAPADSDAPILAPTSIPRSIGPSGVSSDVPSAAPALLTALPSAPVTPPVADCVAIEAEYEGCAAGNFTDGQKSRCEACVAVSYPPAGSSCEAFNQPVCAALQSCDCTPCADQLETYVECLFIRLGFSCDLRCKGVTGSPTVPPATPTTAPVVAAPTTAVPTTTATTDPCDQLLTQAQSCISSELSAQNASECGSCFLDAFLGTTSFPSCADAENYTCRAISNCSTCGSCTDDLEVYFNCTLAEFGCSIGCNLSSPIQPTCDSDLADARSCFQTQLDSGDAAACEQCLSDAFTNVDSFTSCNEAESFSCNALNNCTVCGVCSSAVESYFQCSYALSNCTFSCNPVDDCNPQLGALSLCLDDIEDASTCLSCLAGTVGEIPTSGDCGAVSELACQASSGCDKCQSCSGEVENWLSCSVSGLSGCNVSCTAR